MSRAWVAVCVAVLLAAGCSDESTPTDAAAVAAPGLPADRVERCVDRMIERADPSSASGESVRGYTRDTYCSRFEESGWVYEDGALSIDAQVWLDEGARCTTASENEPARTVPCSEERGERLDCALLHHVRKNEVREYVERLQLGGRVECDDGTPVDGLGVS